jgi:hypothetical protein
MTQLLRLVATGVTAGDADDDELWIRVLDRLLNRTNRRSSPNGPWTGAYSALLLVYAIGIAVTGSGHVDLIYLTLTQAKVQPSHCVSRQRMLARAPKWAAEMLPGVIIPDDARKWQSMSGGRAGGSSGWRQSASHSSRQRDHAHVRPVAGRRRCRPAS